ncbi:MAG: helix-turn-helix transcriptional regulator [Bacteroidota bacterium]
MDIIIIVAGFFGVFIGSYLTFKGSSAKENIWLGILLLELSVFMIVPSLIRLYPNRFIHFTATTFPILFLIGPTTLAYTKKLHKDYLNLVGIVIHSMPSLIILFFMLDFYIQPSDAKLAWLSTIKNTGLPLKYHIIWILACIHITFYFVLASKGIRKVQVLFEQNYSNLARINLKWISFFAIANSILWSLYLIIYLLTQINLIKDTFGIVDKLFALGLGIFIYSIGYHILDKPEIFSDYVPQILKKESGIKYQKTGLTESMAKEKMTYLLSVMTEKKPYLNPDLTLDELAKLTGLSPRHLSQIINQYLNKKFYEFINEFRIDESKKLLQEGNLKILGVAFESGFKSKSTFNYAFKKYVGETPSSYLKAWSKKDKMT